MAFSTTPLIGIDLANGIPASACPTNSAGTAIPPHALGTQVSGSDGKAYVFAKANATISASTTACAINTSTFATAASGGSYTSPASPASLASGDYAWFSKVGV